MKLWGGRFEAGPVGGLRAILRLAALRPPADRRRYPRLAGLRAGAGARRHPDRRRSEPHLSTALRRDRRRGRPAGLLRRRHGRRRPHAGHPQAEGEGRRGWPTRSTPGRSRNEQVSLDMRLWLREEIDGAAALLAALDGGAARAGAANIRTRSFPATRTCGARRRCCGRTTCWPISRCSRAIGSGSTQARRARQRAAARLGRAGRQRLPLRSRGHRQRPRLRRRHRTTAWTFRPTATSRSISSTRPRPPCCT